MTLPFRPTADRVVIKADREEHAPTETESGLVLAKTLAAAVEGTDSEDSWFVGTVVGLGPLVNRFEIRPYITKRLQQLVHDEKHANLAGLLAEIEGKPTDCPDPVHVGDRVIFSWAAGQQITVDADKYLILRQSDILGVLAPEGELTHV